jgi:hypothetical protein
VCQGVEQGHVTRVVQAERSDAPASDPPRSADGVEDVGKGRRGFGGSQALEVGLVRLLGDLGRAMEIGDAFA